MEIKRFRNFRRVTVYRAYDRPTCVFFFMYFWLFVKAWCFGNSNFSQLMNLSFLNFCWLLRCFLLLDHVLNAWSVRCSLIVFQILWCSLSHKVKLQCLICQHLFWRYFLCVLTNAFRYYLDRLMYLHACINLSSSSTLFFLASMMIFRRNPLFIGWLFKNFFLLIVLLNELSVLHVGENHSSLHLIIFY